MSQRNDVIAQWSQSAPYWEKHRELIRQMFAPITDALIEDGRIAGGQIVLDVATGPGEPALSIADVVGPQGKVYWHRPVEAMVEAARRESERRGSANVTFQTAGAENLHFEANSFDAVVSRFGVMFFSSPVDGIREMLRVLKPEGRVALAVWHYADSNPFHYILSRVVDRYVEPIPVAPDAPDAFRFAPRGKLLGVVKEAGADEASERLLQFRIQVPLSLEDYWTLRGEMSDKLRAKLGSLSESQMANLKREVFDAFRPYSSGDGMSFPAEVFIVAVSPRAGKV